MKAKWSLMVAGLPSCLYRWSQEKNSGMDDSNRERAAGGDWPADGISDGAAKCLRSSGSTTGCAVSAAASAARAKHRGGWCAL